MQHLVQHASLSLNARPSERHFRAVNMNIQPRVKWHVHCLNTDTSLKIQAPDTAPGALIKG